jgi:hypothetical protein
MNPKMDVQNAMNNPQMFIINQINQISNNFNPQISSFFLLLIEHCSKSKMYNFILYKIMVNNFGYSNNLKFFTTFSNLHKNFFVASTIPPSSSRKGLHRLLFKQNVHRWIRVMDIEGMGENIEEMEWDQPKRGESHLRTI